MNMCSHRHGPSLVDLPRFDPIASSQLSASCSQDAAIRYPWSRPWQAKRRELLALRRRQGLRQRQRFDVDHAAQDVKARPGAQLVLKGCVMAHRAVVEPSVNAVSCTMIEEVPHRVGEAVEIIRDGEVLDDIALPGIDYTPIGFNPLYHPCLLRRWARLRSGIVVEFGHPVSVLRIQPTFKVRLALLGECGARFHQVAL